MAQSRRPFILLRCLDNAAAGGLVLMAAAAIALIVANSGLATTYNDALHTYVGGLSIQHWINDGLMAIFFLLIGLEIKREFLEGQLSRWNTRILPGVAAVGGMVVPAVIFLAFNLGGDGHPEGWAITSATDIAFALGVLALLGKRVPMSLKVFLTALAIVDDLGAVAIIAVFYTSGLNLLALAGAFAVLGVLIALNIMKVRVLWPYVLLGAGLWFLVLESGVHATLAGVALALVIPLRGGPDGHSPLHRLEHGIQPWVTFLIVPIFGFANAGVALTGITSDTLFGPVPMGVALGLFFGKQIGVFLFAGLAGRMGWAALPMGANWLQLYGIAALCGIGFTMSLFIGLLAYPDAVFLQDQVKIGVLIGSLGSGILGAFLLFNAPRWTKRSGAGTQPS